MCGLKTSLCISILCISCVFSEVKFTGDVTAVSTYVFRGIKQGKGPALQGTAAFSSGFITGGLWLSSVNFSGEIETESDFFLEAKRSVRRLDLAAGVTLYSYDGFRIFNAYSDYELEIYGKAAIDPAGLSIFHVPGQKSTSMDPSRANFWMEMNLHSTFLGTDVSSTLGHGTYSSRFLVVPAKKAVSTLVISIEKKISENISAKYFYSLGLDKNIQNVLFIALSCSFQQTAVLDDP